MGSVLSGSLLQSPYGTSSCGVCDVYLVQMLSVYSEDILLLFSVIK